MAASAHLKTQTQTRKNKRRKHRETTISASAAGPPNDPSSPSPFPSDRTDHRKRDPPTVVDDGSWCCSTAPPPPLPPPQHRRPIPTVQTHPQINGPYEPQQPEPLSVTVTVSSPSPSLLTIRFSPGGSSPLMESSSGSGFFAPYPASYMKFNTALNAGLLNPMSPPPPLARSSPTLFEMMAKEQDCRPRSQTPATASLRQPVSSQDKEVLLQERAAEILASCSPGNQFNDPATSDLKLILSSKEGLSILMNVHRQILVAHSRFFAGKLSDRWSRQQKGMPHLVEINDCDDVEIYMETLMLMYCKELRKRLMKVDVTKVLAILKVCSAIGFDAGILSCLEYLEAAPWAEEEEEKVASLLSQLHLESAGAGEVLKRVSVEVPVPQEGNEEILSQLLHVVLQGKDEKARRDMKGLVSKMLRENGSQNDLSKESLYSACNGCLEALHLNFRQVVEASDVSDVGLIARQADNLHWILDILIDRQIADDFLKTWAGHVEISEAHSKVLPIHRYEVSRVTARLFVGIGKGQILVSKEVRCLLLHTWLEPFYDDFGWMRRACKGLDRHLIEDGLCNTILTLPIDWQQEILLAWFDRFLSSGDDCPNLQRAFEVWWRRAFWRRNGEGDRSRQLRIC